MSKVALAALAVLVCAPVFAQVKATTKAVSSGTVTTTNSTSSLVPVFGTPAKSPWAGHTLCSISDSLFFAGGIPQLEATLLGMNIGMLDLVPGRTVQGMLNDYNGVTASSAYSGIGYARGGGLITEDPGQTLGAALADCDVMQIELGANNSFSGAVSTDYPNGVSWGNYSDTSAAQTLVGYVRADVEELQAINPTMKIVWVGPYVFPAAAGYYTQQSVYQQAALMKQVLADYGVPYVDMIYSGMAPPKGMSPGNYVDASGSPLYGYANNNPHPSPLGAQQLLAPYIARAMYLYAPQ